MKEVGTKRGTKGWREAKKGSEMEMENEGGG